MRKFAESWKVLGRFALLLTAFIAISSGVCVWFFDGPLAEHFRPLFGSPPHIYAMQLTDIGKADHFFAIPAAIAIFAVVGRLTWAKGSIAYRNAAIWAVHFFSAFLVSGVFVQLVKHIVGRKRPYAVESLSPHEFHPFTLNYEFHSMPSGHAQAIFTAATMMALCWPRTIWFVFPFAAIVGFTRVNTLNHWLSDVFVGAAVGILGAMVSYRWLDSTRRFAITQKMLAD